MASKANTQIITTYNDRRIVFYPDSHRYRYEDSKSYLLSPSGIVGKLDKSEALLTWNDGLIKGYAEALAEKTYEAFEVQKLFEEALQLRRTKKQEAADTGTIVHDYAEATAYAKVCGEALPDIPEDAPDEAMRGIQAFLQFEAENEVEYLDAERFVYSERFSAPFVGRFDAVLKINGQRILADYKTAKGVYSSHKYQLAGYDAALTEECNALGKPLPYDALGILHFDKSTGVPTLHVLPEEEREMAKYAFISLLAVADIEKKLYNGNNK